MAKKKADAAAPDAEVVAAPADAPGAQRAQKSQPQ